MENKITKRSEVKYDDTWALEDLYTDGVLWEQAVNELAEYPKQIEEFRGTLGNSADQLLKWFELNDEIGLLAERVATYAFRLSDTDNANGQYQAMRGKASRVLVELSSAGSFAAPELMQISDDVLNKFYEECAPLKLYKYAIDRERRMKDHILGQNEERLLAMAAEMAETPDNIGNMLRDADMKFSNATDSEGKLHQLTQGSFVPLMQSKDRILRKSAFDNLYSVFANFENTTASILDAQIKQLRFFARARKFKDTLEAALIPTEVPVEVYHNLIESVHSHMSTMYKYVALRKRCMALPELHMYDLYVPIVEYPETDRSFEQAKEMVLKATEPLGEEYGNILREAFASRWIDVYENEGKTSGAYSAGARPHPYVLLNYKNDLDSVFTLAHEMGHAVHSYLSMKNQPVVYSDYVIFVAEVASTCNEVLLMQYLLKTTSDRRERAYLIHHFLEQFRTTLYRQTMFAEFEMDINRMSEQGQTLTAELLNGRYYELNKEYYGDNIVIDRKIQSEWARIPHFFYNFYVFQYATGFSAAIALAMKILEEGGNAVKSYIEFLSSGGSADPIELLRRAGVDMASPEPVEKALKLFDELIDEMQGLTK